jgi:hypothetical protein
MRKQNEQDYEDRLQTVYYLLGRVSDALCFVLAQVELEAMRYNNAVRFVLTNARRLSTRSCAVPCRAVLYRAVLRCAPLCCGHACECVVV